MMRNVVDIDAALREQAAWFGRAGGSSAWSCRSPGAPVFRKFFWWYFARVVPRIGRAISRHNEAYTYLPQSVAMFITAEELQRRMEGAGLREVRFRRLMGGTVALHVGTKVR